MGWSFSNFQVRKNGESTKDDLKKLLRKLAKPRFSIFGRAVKQNPYYLYDPGSAWLSVSAEGPDFTDALMETSVVELISEHLGTDVLAITCIDSDCLHLRLVNRKDSTEASAQFGIPMDFDHTSKAEAWQGKVLDYALWLELQESDWGFAEDALPELEPLFGLEPGQGMFCPEFIAERYAASSEKIGF